MNFLKTWHGFSLLYLVWDDRSEILLTPKKNSFSFAKFDFCVFEKRTRGWWGGFPLKQ